MIKMADNLLRNDVNNCCAHAQNTSWLPAKSFPGSFVCLWREYFSSNEVDFTVDQRCRGRLITINASQVDCLLFVLVNRQVD